MVQNIALRVRTDFESCFIPTTCNGLVEDMIGWPRGVLNRSVGDRTDLMTLPSLFTPLEKQVQKNELQYSGFVVFALSLLAF